jgi:DNA repair protein RecO
MGYVTYTTEAIVCGTFDKQGANRTYLLFTEEAGMLYAEAQSVREEKSKQRYAMQDFSLIRISLLRGKSSWRVGSVEPIKNYYFDAKDRKSRGSLTKIVKLLRRFLKGEEPVPEVYKDIHESLELLSNKNFDRSLLELLIEVRFLTKLGYVSKKDLPEHMINHSIEKVLDNQDNVVWPTTLRKTIDQAVIQSQL